MIFDQAITFYYPGKLFGDLTIEQLKKDNYQANTRNKLIAEAFYLTGDVEKYGSGFIRIRNEIKVYPTMKFSVENAPNGLLTVFSYTSQKTSEKIPVHVPEKVGERVGEKNEIRLNENQEKIVMLIEENNSISARQLAEKIGISQRKIEENILKIKKMGILVRKGSPKSGYWVVNDDV